jgi:DNA-binding response OmpR family regulator
MTFERCVVLIADDEPAILQITSRALSRHGYDVITAPDGLSALRAGEERDGPIHLALLDIMMPGLKGTEVSAHLRAIHPKIEVLFMSGYRSEQIDTGALMDAHFIAKPFLPRTLVQRVNQILGNTDVCTLIEDETEIATA